MIGAVDLIDQKQSLRRRFQRLEQRPFDEKFIRIEVDVAIAAQAQELAGIVPLIERVAGVDPLIALQPHKIETKCCSERLRRLGLAHARQALEQQGLAELQGEKGGDAQLFAGKITFTLEALGQNLGR